MNIQTALSTKSTIECINLIVNQHMNADDKIGVVAENAHFDFPNMRLHFRSSINFHVFTFQFYVFYLNLFTSDGLLSTILRMSRQGWFNSKAKFLFFGLDANIHRNILKNIVSFYMFNSIFLDTTNGSVTTIFPFRDGIQRKNDYKTELIGQCYQGDLEIFEISGSLFPEKRPRRWKQGSLNVVYNLNDVFTFCFNCKKSSHGLEINIHELAFLHLNIFAEGSGLYDKNILQMVYEYTFEMAFGTLTMKHQTLFDVTYPYLQEDLVWIVASPKTLPRWKYIFTVFNTHILRLWAFTVITLASVCYFHRRYSKDHSSLSGFKDSVISMVKIFLGQGHEFPRTQIPSVVLSFNKVLLPTMMTFFFGTRLTYLLNGITYEEVKVNSLEDIIDHKMFIGCPSNYLKNIVMQLPEMKGYSENYFATCHSYIEIKNCFARVVDERDMIIVISLKQGIYYLQEMYGSNYSNLVRVLDSRLFVGQFVAVFTKGHPLFVEYNRALKYLVESGIVDMLSRKFNGNWRKVSQILEEVQPLTREHIFTPTVLLIIGMILGVLCLVAERILFAYTH